jgi:pyruvate dehydrogenase E2 component (dihydrolipoamide acetyltransferase)
MAMKEARVPDIGDYTDVPVIEILVSVGDTVVKDQGLVTLESDKATLEVPAPFAGVVKELKVKLGDTLSEGGVVAMIEEADGTAAAASPPAAAATPVTEPARIAAAAVADKPTPPAAPADTPTQPAAPAASPAPVAPEAAAANAGNLSDRAGVDPEAAGPRTPPIAFDADAVRPDKVPHASPAVRLFARELGVDLARVTGSARAGRIGREDVQGLRQIRARPVPLRRRRSPPSLAAGSTCCRGRRSISPSSARSKPCRCRASRRSPAPTSRATGR